MHLTKLIKYLLESSRESIQARISHKIETDKYYGYIPSGNMHLCDMFTDIKKNVKYLGRKRFIDIGCGFATIPKIADVLGFKEARGLEFQEFYCKLDDSRMLIQGDLLNYNFKDYDVLYSYNPIRDIRLMNEGLKNIMNTMKPGAIFYFANAGCINSDLRAMFTQVNSLLKYQKPL